MENFNKVYLLPYLGFDEIEKEEKVVIKLKVNDLVLDDDGRIPSGVFATMLDTAIGATISEEGNGFGVTISLNCSYFDLSNRGSYAAYANVVNRDGSIVTGEGFVLDPDGTIVARGIGTFKVTPKK